MKRSAFTLTELVITLIVITLAVTVTLPITKKKLEKADKIGYYRAYQIARDISKQLNVKSHAETYLEMLAESGGYDSVNCGKSLYSCTFEYAEKDTCRRESHEFTDVPIEYCQPTKLGEITDCGWSDQGCDMQITAGPSATGRSVKDLYSSDAFIKENPLDRVIKIAKEKFVEFDKFLASITKPADSERIGLCPAARANSHCIGVPLDQCDSNIYVREFLQCIEEHSPYVDDNEPHDCELKSFEGTYSYVSSIGCSGGYSVCINDDIFCKSCSNYLNGQGNPSNPPAQTCDSTAKPHNQIPTNPWTFNGSCKWVDASFGLCKKIKDNYNDARGKYKMNDNTEPCIAVKDEDVDHAAYHDRNFRADVFDNPQILLDNGMIIHILSDTPSKIAPLTASETEQASASNSGFTIFIDINGKSGKSNLYEDVFPFYLMLDGSVVPDYDYSGIGGANDSEMLSFGVTYNDFSSGSRQIKSLENDISYQRAACLTGAVTSPVYCKDAKANTTISKSSICTTEANCKIKVNKPFVMFGNLFE